jgi:predicted dithiol-disulfide oxidoreductase (DUF899 family)
VGALCRRLCVLRQPGIVQHLDQRDVTFVAVSRAPLAKLQAFAARLGWSFLASGSAIYNYVVNKMSMSNRRALPCSSKK